MGYPHSSGDPCPRDDCDGEKVVHHNPNARIPNEVDCSNEDCDWEAENMATG